MAEDAIGAGARAVVFPDAFTPDAAEKVEILLHDHRIQQRGPAVNCHGSQKIKK